MNLNGSRNSGLLSWVSSVGSGISGFEEENPPSDPPKSVFGEGDPSPTVTGVGLVGFRVGPGSLGWWVGSRVGMDTPNGNKYLSPQNPFNASLSLILLRFSQKLHSINQPNNNIDGYGIRIGCRQTEAL